MKVENLGKLCKLNMVKKKIPPPNEQIYIYIFCIQKKLICLCTRNTMGHVGGENKHVEGEGSASAL